MRNHRQEARLRAVGGFRLVARVGERALGLHAVGDVAADTLHLGAGQRRGPHHHLTPGDPARAGVGRDLLVVDACSVGRMRRGALFQHRQRERSADKLGARPLGQHAECVVDIGDAAVDVAANDHVALRGEKALRALFRFLELPVAVGKLLDALLLRAQLALEQAHPREQQTDRAAGRAEQAGHADREHMRIVVCGRAAHRRDEAERGRERHRQEDRAADDDRQNQRTKETPARRKDRSRITPPRHGLVAGALQPRVARMVLLFRGVCGADGCDWVQRRRPAEKPFDRVDDAITRSFKF